MTIINRRSFLKGIVAGALVVGFDPKTRSWLTEAEGVAAASSFPTFDGVLYTDATALNAAAEDYGHIIHRIPMAVLKPASVNDIIKLVKFARNNNIKIAGRGQGHSTYGQPLVEAGVVIDMSGLNTIHTVKSDYAIVDAGATWHNVLDATLACGLTPPVMTDYIELSVGGTLSVGGIGGVSHQYGVQIDNVLELEVVTGEGKLEPCSAKHKRKLFDAVLGGLGQCGIIVRAKIKLIPAQTNARVFMLYYNDLATFTSDQLKLVGDKRFSYVEGQVVPKATGGWYFMLEAVKFYSASNMPNNAALVNDLAYNRGEEIIEDKTYFDFLNRLAPVEAFLRSIGVWYFPHPWYDVFVPTSEVNEYVGTILETLTLDDTGQGPILMYPVNTSLFKQPLFRVPEGQTAFLFDILRTAPPVPAVVEAMVADNRRLFEDVVAVGGVRYPIGAIPVSQAEWQQHFGSAWKDFEKAKKAYDPDNILAPGQGIF